MDIFKNKNFLKFSDQFKTDEICKQYLHSLKVDLGYNCLRCNHSACQIRKDLARQCNICGHIESATANTLFHKVKFGVRKAFFICFETATSGQKLSASYIADRYGITEKTARLFMIKVRAAMISNDKNLVSRSIHNEFILGGKNETIKVINKNSNLYYESNYSRHVVSR